MSDEEKMTVFVTSGPDTPQRCATPFYMANIAAAMDNEAEMIFQIDGVLLRVEMRVCSAALQLHEMTEDDLIEECDGVVGAAYMVDVGLESGMVLNY